MARSFHSFFETLSLLCRHHGVDADLAFKRFLATKSRYVKKTAADKECSFVRKLGDGDAEVLGISTPAYRVFLTRGGSFIFFIGSYRDGGGNTVKYADVSTSNSLRARSGDTSRRREPDARTPEWIRPRGAAESWSCWMLQG